MCKSHNFEKAFNLPKGQIGHQGKKWQNIKKMFNDITDKTC